MVAQPIRRVMRIGGAGFLDAHGPQSPPGGGAPPPASRPMGSDMTLNPAKLLLVQDNPFLAEMTARGLRERGYRVLPVPHEAQALTALRDQRFDLVVLDLDLRRCEGLSLVRAVAPRAPLVPLVVLLGPVNYEDALMQLAPGRAVWRLDRPYALDALATVVGRLTRARGRRPAAKRRSASPALTDLIEA